MHLEQEFDRRIAAMHGLNNPHTSDRHTGENPIGTRHTEFQVMADVFLGEREAFLHAHQAGQSQRCSEDHCP